MDARLTAEQRTCATRQRWCRAMGGTAQIQKNMIAARILPGEPYLGGKRSAPSSRMTSPLR